MDTFIFVLHILVKSTWLDVSQQSQFFDKDLVVCSENSFCSVMTFRIRTSAILFCNLPTEK